MNKRTVMQNTGLGLSVAALVAACSDTPSSVPVPTISAVPTSAGSAPTTSTRPPILTSTPTPTPTTTAPVEPGRPSASSGIELTPVSGGGVTTESIPLPNGPNAGLVSHNELNASGAPSNSIRYTVYAPTQGTVEGLRFDAKGLPIAASEPRYSADRRVADIVLRFDAGCTGTPELQLATVGTGGTALTAMPLDVTCAANSFTVNLGTVSSQVLAGPGPRTATPTTTR